LRAFGGAAAAEGTHLYTIFHFYYPVLKVQFKHLIQLGAPVLGICYRRKKERKLREANAER